MERDNKDDTIKLNKPFWSAGRMYHWEGDPIGFGVASSLLRTNGTLTIKTGGKTYKIDKEEARKQVRFYNSFYMAGKTKLAVIPKFAFICEPK